MKNDEVQIGLIVACSENGVIGVDGDLPWRLPDDLKHFMRSTKGHSVVMGRKTFESLHEPLKGRLNIVVSSTMPIEDGVEGHVEVARSLDEALSIGKRADQGEDGFGKGLVWVAGGGEIYRQSMEHADLVVRTRVHCEIEGDVRFAELDEGEWLLDRAESHEIDEQHGFAFTIEWWKRGNE